MRSLFTRSLVLGTMLAASSQANIFFDGTTETAATFLGASTGPNGTTTRCNSLTATPTTQQVPTGVIIHARNSPFLGQQVSGIQLVCDSLADHGDMVARQIRPVAGHASSGQPAGIPHLRLCPTGNALVGLSGRTGGNVDAVTIRCAPMTPNILTGAVARGTSITVGNPIYGSSGNPGSSLCPAPSFVRSISVFTDGSFVRQMRVNCRSLQVPFRLPQFLANVFDLAVMPFGQQRVFEGAVTHNFSLAIANMGRDVNANAATVDVVFDTTRANIVGPASCSRTELDPDTIRIRCSTPAILMGGRATIPGFSITPTGVLDPIATVGSVVLNFAVDIDPDNNDSNVDMLRKSVVFP